MLFRNYRDTDYEALCAFLIALSREDRMHINWNWARFEWMYEHPEFDKKARSSIGLWLNGEEIVGAAIYDMYFGEAFCGVLPAYASLYPEVLDYAYGALRDDAGLGVAVCDENAAEIAALSAQGFAPAEQGETIMTLPLDRELPAALPEGFRFVELDPVRDAYALAWLVWQGFDHGQVRAEFERTETIVPRVRRHFDPRLAVAAAGPDGENAACCCVWYDARTDYAYVEPLCTIPAQRGRGVARAILYEALNRARALGAERAHVISDMAFYEKLGFRKERHFTFYWKP